MRKVCHTENTDVVMPTAHLAESQHMTPEKSITVCQPSVTAAVSFQ